MRNRDTGLGVRRIDAKRRRAAALIAVAASVAIGCGTTAPQESTSTNAAQSGSAGISQSGSNPESTAAGGPQSADVEASLGTPTQGAAGPGGQVAGGQRTTGPAASTAPGGPVACNVARTGPGWDAKNVYVGAAIQSDASEVGGSIGFSAFDFGDQRAIAEAAINWLNDEGGLCGRTVVPVWYDVDSLNDVNQEAQAACTKWTQDQRVISASLVPNLNIPNMYACLAKAGILINTLTGSPSLKSGLEPYMPYLLLKNTVSWDHFADFWLDRLEALGYFKGWNTANGSPGPAPVKVAILFEDDPIATPAWKALRDALERRHITVEAFVSWGDPAAMSGYVLQFRSQGVTHLFLDRLAGVFYPSQAQSQDYYARYALSSQNFIQPFLANGPAPAQLRGAMGVGWHPHIDVAQAQDPGALPGSARCIELMRNAGVDVSKRNYQFVATASCDGTLLARESVRAGGGFTAEQMIKGVHATAPTLPWANMFGLAGRPGEAGLLSTTRDLLYDVACTCIRYSGLNVQIP